MRATTNKVVLTKGGLLKDKENGLTVPEIATKYGLSKGQMTKALKIAGITTRAKAKTTFVFAEETEVTPEVSPVVNNNITYLSEVVA